MNLNRSHTRRKQIWSASKFGSIFLILRHFYEISTSISNLLYWCLKFRWHHCQSIPKIVHLTMRIRGFFLFFSSQHFVMNLRNSEADWMIKKNLPCEYTRKRRTEITMFVLPHNSVSVYLTALITLEVNSVTCLLCLSRFQFLCTMCYERKKM